MIILEDSNNKAGDYTVYMHIFPDGKKYIGATRQPVKERWHGGSGYKNQKRLYSAIRDAGWSNIKHEITASCLPKEEAQRLEIEYIKKYDTQNPSNGYNTLRGGQVFGKHSDEFLRNLKERMAGNKYCAGRKLSKEHIEAMRQSNLGRHYESPFKGTSIWTEEDRKKQSERAKERWKNKEFREKCLKSHAPMDGKNNPMYGKKHSAETKEKIRQKALGRKVSEQRRKEMSEKAKKRRVAQYSKDMCLIMEFNSIKEAATKYGLHSTNIGFCCKNKNRTAGGYYWRYIDDDN